MDGDALTGLFKQPDADDFRVIKLLKLRLGVKFHHIDEIGGDTIGYVLNEQRQVTGLGLPECNINDVQRIIDLLHQLTSLVHLNLSENRLRDVSPLSGLTSLEELSLHNNELTDVSPLAGLTLLKELYLFNNQLTDVTALGCLTSLEHLSLWRNQLKDVSVLRGLTSLKELYLAFNQLTDVSPLSGLTSLRRLVLYMNPITTLPLALTDLPLSVEWKATIAGSDGFITFYDNPLESPPPEIVAQGMAAVRSYLLSLEKAKQAGQQVLPLQEVKVHLVGDGMAGKTSLLKQLQGLDFDEHESQTHGITVAPLKAAALPGFPGEDELGETLFHFWDFGGQEIMHASHQFFMSSRSIYLLLLDSRTDSNKYYWLRHIEKYGGTSPVIVVMNKIDENPSYNIQHQSINQQFPAIRNRFHRVSCFNRKGVDGVLDSLADSLKDDGSLYGTPFAPAWMAVKEALVKETSEKRYIGRSRYDELCLEQGIDDQPSRDTLLGYLNSLGIVLFFRELDFADIYVLDPHWVTVGVYRIINSSRTATGIFRQDELDWSSTVGDDFCPKKTCNSLFFLIRCFEYLKKVVPQNL